MEKKQKTIKIPRTHCRKETTAKQEVIIKQIQEDLQMRTMLEAKHEYFENQETYDKLQGTKLIGIKGIAQMKQNVDVKKEQKEAEQSQVGAQETPQQDEKKKRNTLTIFETKLGVTMVISKEDCKALGFTGKEKTKEAIQKIREKLGLPMKGGKKC